MNLVHEGVLDPNEPDFRDEKREEEKAQEARQKRETLSVDELADKVREIAAIIHTDEFHEESHDLERLADEIKEAWKRVVVSKTETTTFGNVAAILDALKTIHDKVNSLDEECGVDPVEVRDIARTALSAPARNCDLPLSVDGPAETNSNRAWHVFKCRNPGAYFDVPGLLRCIDWLLAPAAERKGEGDGR